MDENEALRQELEALKQKDNAKDAAASIASIVALFAGALLKSTDARMTVVFVYASILAAADWCDYKRTKLRGALMKFCFHAFMMGGAGALFLVPVLQHIMN